MTERKFMKDGMKQGPTMKLEKQAKILKEGMIALKKGKIEYFWLFPCGIWSLQHFISWSTNMFGPTERNEIHMVFYNTLCIFHFTGPNTHFLDMGMLSIRSFRLGMYKPSVIAML